jgi:uncharacterized protein (DUF58 family)
VRARLAALRDRLLARAEKRLPGLNRHRRPEPVPIALTRRRIYILPTGFGLFFGAVLFTMLMGALNFNNNAALLLTFVLAGAVVVSLPRTVAELERLRLVAVRAAPAHAGEPLRAQVDFVVDDARARPSLVLRCGAASIPFVLAGEGGGVRFELASQRRGLQPVGRLTLSTTWPLGLFRAWSVMHPDLGLLVWPRAEPKAPPLPRAGTPGDGRAARDSGEDWSGLRDYRAGDPKRRIAWRASARSERLLVKEFSDPVAQQVVLDWNLLQGMDPEARIARLTRWVLEASASGVVFRLALPGGASGYARGPDHAAQCLRDLALLP